MNSSAGIGDPYWYEWSIGQQYIVEMLDERSPIIGVTLQATGLLGLDDVVVRENERTTYIQVKHTRESHTLTFTDLLSLESADQAKAGEEKTKKSLLQKLSSGWNTERSKATLCNVILKTNRLSSEQGYRPRDSYLRPPLSDFWERIVAQRHSVASLDDFSLPDEWRDAWQQFRQHLSSDDETSKLEFLKSFEIQSGLPDLGALKLRLEARIVQLLGVNATLAADLLASLDSSLRVWATSVRGRREEVDREMLYASLSLTGVANHEVGDHELAPPAPFHASRLETVRTLSALITSSDTKVVFFAGAPGSGKTSVVSFIANQHDSTIDFRYHAFKPLLFGRTESEELLASPEVLWGDLLCQLRKRLKGLLHKYRPAVRNDFLNSEQRKQEFLRVCSLWALDRGRAVVVAIDGLDHAARSQRLSGRFTSFLSSLPSPEELPSGVKILFAGQPDYAEYSLWMRAQTQGMSRLDLPCIGIADVRKLLETAKTNMADTELAAQVIQDFCKGNTLSTHFAVQEALDCGNLADLQERLVNRKLNLGLQAYYDHLWTAATSRDAGLSPVRIATLLSLIQDSVPHFLLDCIVNDAASQQRVIDVLRKLKPLVVESDGKYSVFHNDFRVYLGEACKNAPELAETAGRLVELLKSSKAEITLRQRYLFRLQELSGQDIAATFSPEWILEAWYSGSSLSNLVNQARKVSHYLQALPDRRFEQLHLLSSASETIAQLHSSLDWSQEEQRYLDRRSNLSEGRIANELRVIPVSEWNIDLLLGVARDASYLIQHRSPERAKALLDRWFGTVSVEDTLQGWQLDKEDYKKRELTDKSALFFQEFGRCWAGLRKIVGVPPSELHAQANLVRGALQYSLSQRDWRFIARLISHRFGCFIVDMEKLVEEALWASEFAIAAVVLRRFAQKENVPDYLRIKFAAATLLAGSDVDIQRDVAKLDTSMLSRFQKYDDESSLPYRGVESLACFCLLASYGPSPKTSLIEAAYVRLGTLYDVAEAQSCSSILAVASRLGSWLWALRNSRPFLGWTPQEFERVCTITLWFQERRPIPGVHLLCTKLAAVLFWCGDRTGTQFADKVTNLAETWLKEGRLGRGLALCWGVVHGRRKVGRLTAFVNLWLDPVNGKIWSVDAGCRREYFEDICSLAKGIVPIPPGVGEKLKWGCIQYSGHKDHSLESVLKVYEALSKRAARVWRIEGRELIDLSNSLPEDCDNRLGHHIQQAVVRDAVRSGPEDFHAFLLSNPEDGGLYVYQGLVAGFLDGIASLRCLGESDKLDVWFFCLGFLNWRDSSNLEDIHRLHHALVNMPQGFLCQATLESRCSSSGVFQTQHEPAKRDEDPLQRVVESASFEEALAAIESHLKNPDLGYKGEAWRAIGIVLRRLYNESPPHAAQQVHRLRSLLELREKNLPWYFDGAHQAYTNLVPLLNSTELRSFTASVLEALDSTDSDRQWLDAAKHNLRSLAIAIASQQDDGEALKDCFKRAVAVQKTWLSGAGNIPWRMRETAFSQGLGASDWGLLGFEVLLTHLSKEGSTTVSSALRGLYLLSSRRSDLLSKLDERWEQLASEVQSYLLLLLETWTRKFPQKFFAIASCVRRAYEGADLENKLQAWVIYRTRELGTGEQVPPIVWSPSSDTLLYRYAHPVFRSRQSKSRGHLHLSTEESAVRGMLDRLESISGQNMGAVEEELAHYTVNNNPKSDTSPDRGTRDLLLKPAGKSRILFDIVHRELANEAFSSLSPGLLAAALSHGDEPELLIADEPAIQFAQDWISDELLEKGPQPEIVSEFSLAARRDISQHNELFACEIRTYTRSSDWTFNVDPLWRQHREIFQSSSPASTMLSRCFTYFDEYPDPTSGGIALINRVGSLIRFFTAALWLTPPSRLMRFVGWKPRPERPFEWFDGDERVLWLERIAGPLNRNKYEKVYRTPMMHRWVISSSKFSSLKESLGGYITFAESSRKDAVH